MTQEDKELLLKDLCSRIPYGVKVQMPIWDYNDKITTEEDATLYSVNTNDYCETVEYDAKISVEEITPYLFPMSSMTEEQKEEYYYIVNYISSDDTENWVEGEFIYVNQIKRLLHFYNTNHLDYNDLIPKGLAIDATGLNIY